MTLISNMLFTVFGYLVSLASIATAYRTKRIDPQRPLHNKINSEVIYLPRQSPAVLYVRDHNDLTNVLQPRGNSPKKSTPQKPEEARKLPSAESRSPARRPSPKPNSGSLQGMAGDRYALSLPQPWRNQANRSPHSGSGTKAGSISSAVQQSRIFKLKNGVAHGSPSRGNQAAISAQASTPDHVGPSSSSVKSRKHSGLYHNPWFKKEHRISREQLDNLFPASDAKSLTLSIDQSNSRPPLPLQRAPATSIAFTGNTRPSQLIADEEIQMLLAGGSLTTKRISPDTRDVSSSPKLPEKRQRQ